MCRLAASVCAACLFFVASAQTDEGALQVLMKALEGQRSVRATLLQKRSDGGYSISVTVQIDPKKGIRATITRPFVYAGVVSFDDGTEWSNYDPHTNVLRIERSPMTFSIDPALREKLIRKNFLVTSEQDTVVAGRKAKVIYMKGVFSQMSNRRIAIDATNSLILRYEVERPDGKCVTMVETSQAEIGVPVIGNKIEDIAPSDAKIERTWGPVLIQSPGMAKDYVGFVPAVPTQFPAGLALQAIHVLGDGATKFVGVRLSDGMAVATVYLWKAEAGAPEPFSGESDGTTSSGINVRVMGEVSDVAKKQLIDIFLKLNQPRLGPQEQAQAFSTLTLNRSQAWGEPLPTSLYFR